MTSFQNHVLHVFWILCGLQPFQAIHFQKPFLYFLHVLKFTIFTFVMYSNIVLICELVIEKKIKSNHLTYHQMAIVVLGMCLTIATFLFTTCSQLFNQKNIAKMIKLLAGNNFIDSGKVTSFTLLQIALFTLAYCLAAKFKNRNLTFILLTYLNQIYSIYYCHNILNIKFWINSLNKEFVHSLQWFNINKVLITDKSRKKNTVKYFVDKLEIIIKAASLINKNCGFLMLTLLLSCCEKIVANLYAILALYMFGFIQCNQDHNLAMLWLFWVVVSVVELFTLVYPTHYVDLEMAKFKDLILSQEDYNPEVKQALLFLECNKIKFSPFDLFSLDMNFILKALGVTTMFLVIFLQLEHETKKPK